MGAIVSDNAIVGVWSVVGEGCVVKNNQIVEDRKIVVGVPAKVVGEVSDEYKELWTNYKNVYVALAQSYPKKLEIVEQSKTQLNTSTLKRHFNRVLSLLWKDRNSAKVHST
jgi:carbonic anhydrase/acetyltransferase-like protein (isoleucine patch superfamily)